MCALAERLGLDQPGFKMTAWEVIEETCRISGLPDAETLWRNHWHDCSLGEDEMHFKNGFGPNKKFRFKPKWTRWARRRHAIFARLLHQYRPCE